MKIRNNIYTILFVVSIPNIMYSSDVSDNDQSYIDSGSEVMSDISRAISQKSMPLYGIFEDDLNDVEEVSPGKRKRERSKTFRLKKCSLDLNEKKQKFTEKIIKDYLASKYCHFQYKTGETTPVFVWSNPAHSQELTADIISDVINDKMEFDPERYWRMQFALVVNPETNDDNEKKTRAEYYRNRMSQNFYMVTSRERKTKFWEVFSDYFVNFFNKDKEDRQKISAEHIYSLEHAEIYKKFKSLFYQELRRRDPKYAIIPRDWIPQKDIVEKGEIEHGNSKKIRRRNETNDDSDKRIKRVDIQKPEDGISFLLNVAQNQEFVAKDKAPQTSQQPIQPKGGKAAPVVSDDDELDPERELQRAYARDVASGVIQQTPQTSMFKRPQSLSGGQTNVLPSAKLPISQVKQSQKRWKNTQVPPVNPQQQSNTSLEKKFATQEQYDAAKKVLQLIGQYNIAIPGYNAPISTKTSKTQKQAATRDAQTQTSSKKFQSTQEASDDETQSE